VNWGVGLNEIERKLSDPTQRDSVLTIFGVNGTNIRDSDFMSFVSDVFTG